MQALASHLDWRRGLLIPEAAVKCGRGVEYLADAMWVTDSGYATELEVKVSRADWKADLEKPKWKVMPPWVTRFIYVVPAELGIPEWVPEFAGVWHIREFGERLKIEVARAPRRIGKDLLPDERRHKWLGNLYYRFWTMQHKRWGSAQARMGTLRRRAAVKKGLAKVKPKPEPAKQARDVPNWAKT